MKSIKKTYFIFWIALLIITMILFFTLPSICLFYDIESLNSLISKVGSLSGIGVGGFSVAKLPTLMKSYFGVYVPSDFPNNNMPVKIGATFIFIVLMYIENYVIVNKTLDRIKKEDDAFFNIPIIMQSIIIMVATTFVSLLCVINNNIYYVLVIVIYLIVFIISLLIFFSVNTVKEHIVSVENENKSKKRFIEDLNTDIEILLNNVSDENSKNKLKKLLEEIKYSVVVSNDKLAEVETKIHEKLSNIKVTVEENSNLDMSKELDNIIKLINERNILARK